jgi:succinoglycan biosynthesis transport protein ExoP
MKASRELIKSSSDFTSLDRSPDAPANSHSYSYGVDPNAETEVNLLDYWRAVRKRLWLVLSIMTLITMLSVIYVARKPDVYQAGARVQVDLENNAALVGKTPYVFGPTNDPVYFNTQLQILVSPGLMRRVVKTLDLEHNPNFFKAQKRTTWQTIRKMAGFGNDDPPPVQNKVPDNLQLDTTVAALSSHDDRAEAKRLQRYVGRILGGLKVDPVKETRGLYKETRLIDISYTHEDPEVAAKVVNAIAETYVYNNLERKTETNTNTGTVLQKRIAELQQTIRTDEERLVNYAKNNQILSLDANQNTVVERLGALNKQLGEAENARIDAESRFNTARDPNRPGAATALTEADQLKANESETRLADLRQKRAQLMVDATDEAPEVKEIDTQIGELERQVNEIRSRKSNTLLTNLETNYRQTLAREQALRKSFQQQRGETLTQNEAAINYRIIQQEIQTNKTLLDNLLQRSKENDVIMASKPNNISIIDYAMAPDGPIGPNRMRTVFMALFLSLGLGVGFALFLEYLDDTVHSTDEVERLLHLPALAVIPSAAASGRRRLITPPGALAKRNGHGSDNVELLMNVDGRSPLAEAYRHLRTSVLLSTAGRAPRSLLITSSLPGEGKTTTAVNTAVSLGQTGATVVIIDADMRRPRLRSIFGLSERAGLSSILSSDMTEAEMLALVSKDEVSGLSVLTSGPIPPNPAELLGSDQMRRLMAALQSQFNHVVVDSPPVTSFTDGVLIASIVDGVLLVVHGGKSSRHVVKRARQLLNDVGAKIFGVVLNNVNLQSHDYYYYQRYYGSQYYKSDVDEESERASA